MKVPQRSNRAGGGWAKNGVGGIAHSEEERKGTVPREPREQKADRELDIEVWLAGLWASVSCRGLQMALRIKSNCADCQGMGSVTHPVPHERGVTLAQREEAEGESRRHTVKIAFK